MKHCSYILEDAKKESRILSAYQEKKWNLGTQEHTFLAAAKWAYDHPLWISVEDELPPTQEDVLVCRKDGETRVAWLANKTWRTIDGYPLNDNITHWMHLPPLPTTKKGNKE